MCTAILMLAPRAQPAHYLAICSLANGFLKGCFATKAEVTKQFQDLRLLGLEKKRLLRSVKPGVLVAVCSLFLP